jgi:2-keto-4-pentenoate hydratase/2-oxohepta-3-ene-1,7-dioic acid hydratase in catechol pathway
MIFNKQTTAVNGPRDPIHRPRVSDKLDYEGELAFVIGRRCRHVPAGRAREVIAGYTVCDDVSVRDWQVSVPTFTMGKSFDTHCPLGPWMVTGDELDPHNLGIRTWVNGELRQSSNTKHLIFDVFALVEHLSTAFTLEPGDVIPTGTPSGVGIAMKPPKMLVAGDVVRIAIDGIGEIEGSVIAEPSDTARIG